MLHNWEFQLPTQIQFGCGGLENLGAAAGEFGKSALLVGYRDRTGLEETYARASRALSRGGLAAKAEGYPADYTYSGGCTGITELIRNRFSGGAGSRPLGPA